MRNNLNSFVAISVEFMQQNIEYIANQQNNWDNWQSYLSSKWWIQRSAKHRLNKYLV